MPLHPALGGNKAVYRRHASATAIQAVVRRKQKQRTYKNLKLARPVDKLVQRKIDKNNPSKYITFHQRRYQFSNLIADDPLNRIHAIIPYIAQGTQRNDREGAKVKLASCNIKGRIDIPADDNPALPIGANEDRAQIYVRLFVLSVKQTAILSSVASGWNAGYNDYFFKNNASPTAPQGNYLDMLSEVNREMFTVHHDKVMKLDRNLGYFPDPTSTSGAGTQKPVSREFNIKLKCKNKILDFNQPGSVQPQNFQPFVCCLFAYGNGAVPSVAAVPFIEYLSKLTFKD